MDRREDILRAVRDLGIPFALYEHEPKRTIEDCLNTPGLDPRFATMPKNVFLANRQQTAFYLLLLSPKKPYRTRVVSKLLGVSRLSFARNECLNALLQTDSGAVSPLNLLFDAEKRVQLVIDKELLAYERLWFHPGSNEASLEMSTADFLTRFLPGLEVEPVVLTIPLSEGD